MKEKAERICILSKGKETTERVWSKYLDQLSAYQNELHQRLFSQNE